MAGMLAQMQQLLQMLQISEQRRLDSERVLADQVAANQRQHEQLLRTLGVNPGFQPWQPLPGAEQQPPQGASDSAVRGSSNDLTIKVETTPPP
jgi:hypothetical protein